MLFIVSKSVTVTGITVLGNTGFYPFLKLKNIKKYEHVLSVCVKGLMKTLSRAATKRKSNEEGVGVCSSTNTKTTT